MYLLHFQCSFLEIEIFLVMESSAIVWFCNKLCGAAIEREVSQGYALKNHPGVGEMESILRAFSISLSLLSMERRSKDVFSVLQKNMMLQSDRTLFLYCHVFPPPLKAKIYITNQCWGFFKIATKNLPSNHPKPPKSHETIKNTNQTTRPHKQITTKKPKKTLQHLTPKTPHKQTNKTNPTNKWKDTAIFFYQTEVKEQVLASKKQ